MDVCNYSLTYKVCGFENHMSPDNHFQDLKRIISAATGKAKRISVVMPFLYEGRQHKRTKRESLDCSLALQELVDMGVSNIITFDAHDPRVQNAIPLSGFDSFMPTYQFLKALVDTVPDFRIDNDHLMVISPDEGAMSRAVYFSSILGVDMGMVFLRIPFLQKFGSRDNIQKIFVIRRRRDHINADLSRIVVDFPLHALCLMYNTFIRSSAIAKIKKV